jgi:3-oxoacyl-[acyl-carrier-protein] synthase III
LNGLQAGVGATKLFLERLALWYELNLKYDGCIEHFGDGVIISCIFMRLRKKVLALESILTIYANGVWNGGAVVDNSHFENRGLAFKNSIPVNGKTIEERIGVRTRIVAPEDARIGVIAFQDLLDTSQVDPARIKLLIGATNVGEDKYDPGPLIRYPCRLIQGKSENIAAMDLYAGCPGFNVSVELVFMMSLCGMLEEGDISVIVGAENLHRAKAFKKEDTAGIIFGDDALATAFRTTATASSNGDYSRSATYTTATDADSFVDTMARALLDRTRGEKIDGIIVDNQLGAIQYRVPPTAARVQHRLAELTYEEAAADGTFERFRDALKLYDAHVDAFAFDIMSMAKAPDYVGKIAEAYVRSGKYKTVVSAYLASDFTVSLAVHRGSGFVFTPPRTGIVDTATSTHGCFAHYIEAVPTGNDVFAEMDGKGVFLYATRGAPHHFSKLLAPNGLTLHDLDLLIEHQANFAMIPLTLEQLMADRGKSVKQDVMDFIANKMPINIHVRGNCSVVCMQRLPYDLQRDALAPDTIQGFAVNRNLEGLKSAKVILCDSVGAGMTRSSFLQRLP